ncbi:MAG: tRNA-guanine transglycosylase [Niabella sp.]|nr:MAG: tRNA-guanine transglycosylase [Niabella sp.]
MEFPIKSISSRGRKIILPDFYPDATRGVIRSLSAQDLKDACVNGVIVNTYHLLSQPGTEVIKNVGGIKNLMGFDGTVISDSGGFQLFSLIQKNKSLGKIDRETGVTFNLHSKKGSQKYNITPEKCIQIQFDLGTDIMIVLDYFTPYGASDREISQSVTWTTEWAARCKKEFEKQCQIRNFSEHNRPLLFGVVQGAHSFNERERSAKELENIGFDGYGLGGWTFDQDGKFDLSIIKQVAAVTPDSKPKYGLGVGDPQSLVDTLKAGFGICDCVLPTRDARHKRLYNFSKDPESIKNIFEEPAKSWYEYMYVAREKYMSDTKPISEFCDCYACCNHNSAYLNHLFKVEDSLAFRLATIHNLRFYSKVIELARKALI